MLMLLRASFFFAAAVSLLMLDMLRQYATLRFRFSFSITVIFHDMRYACH